MDSSLLTGCPPCPLVSGWRVSWGEVEAWGQAEDYVPQSSRALAMAAHWLGPGALSPPRPTSDLMAQAVSLGCGPWDQPLFTQPKEPEG